MIGEAAVFAERAHRGVFRKGTDIPYITHPMEAAVIVSAFTDDEEMIAAALLHDVMEDAGVTRGELEQAFGPRVAWLVMDESEDKMELLRKLDKSATRKGMIVSITLGVLGCLLLGIGMCFTMVWVEWFIYGIPVGLIGIALIITAYPAFARITKKERERLAPRIIELTEELSGEDAV